MKYLSYKKLERLSEKYQTSVSNIQRKIIQCCQDRENFMHYVIMYIDNRPIFSFRDTRNNRLNKNNTLISKSYHPSQSLYINTISFTTPIKKL